MKISNAIKLFASCVFVVSTTFATPGIVDPLKPNDIKEFDNIHDLCTDLMSTLKMPEPTKSENSLKLKQDCQYNSAASLVVDEEPAVLELSLVKSPEEDCNDDSNQSASTNFTVFKCSNYLKKPTTALRIFKDTFQKIESFRYFFYDFFPRKQNDTIVLFDCDNVLQVNIDATLQNDYIWDFLKKVPKDLWNTVIWDGQKALVENGMLDLVRNLQSNGIPVFVFTRCSSDPEIMGRRIDTLNRLGFDFRSDMFGAKPQDLPLPDGYVLEAKPGQNAITSPKYFNGVFFMGSADKCAGLKASINFIYAEAPYKFVPMNRLRVILVDDEEKNLIDAEKACQEYGIAAFKGYHYTAAKKLSDKNRPKSIITETQLQAVSNQNVWLTDTRAMDVALLSSDPLEAALGLA